MQQLITYNADRDIDIPDSMIKDLQIALPIMSAPEVYAVDDFWRNGRVIGVDTCASTSVTKYKKYFTSLREVYPMTVTGLEGTGIKFTHIGTRVIPVRLHDRRIAYIVDRNCYYHPKIAANVLSRESWLSVGWALKENYTQDVPGIQPNGNSPHALKGPDGAVVWCDVRGTKPDGTGGILTLRGVDRDIPNDLLPVNIMKRAHRKELIVMLTQQDVRAQRAAMAVADATKAADGAHAKGEATPQPDDEHRRDPKCKRRRVEKKSNEIDCEATHDCVCHVCCNKRQRFGVCNYGGWCHSPRQQCAASARNPHQYSCYRCHEHNGMSGGSYSAQMRGGSAPTS